MDIDRKLVETVADLAKLHLDEDNLGEYIHAMSEILDLAEQMLAVDTDGIAPLAHPLEAVQRLRDDEVTETDQHERLQSLAPEVSDGLYLVPRVIE